MRFGLFLLVNVVLIIRPTEIISGLEDLPVYYAVILAALVAAARSILGQFTPAALAASPITTCVLGFLVAIVLSHLANGAVREAIASGMMFVKVALYYLLLVANLRTARDIRVFLVVVCGLMTVQAGLAVLQFFGYIDIEALRPFEQRMEDYGTGETVGLLPRLCGAGIFHDPNDLCVLLVIGAVFTLYLTAERRLGPGGFAAAVPLGVFLGAIPLTASRGGMLALFAALTTFAFLRLGARRGVMLILLALPLTAVVLGGRMTQFELDNPDDTSQHRLRHWSDGLVAFRGSPVFGIGQGTYEALAGHVAHNSYVEAYTELGVLGGTLFTGAFVYAAWALIRVGRRLRRAQAPTLARLHPCLLTAVIALMIGMVSLSRNYTSPTYLILGLATAYLRVAGVHAPGAVPPLTLSLSLRWTGLSILFIAAMSLGTALLVQWR